jgi:ribosomal protein S18 acetylase RimI-like enzyme
VEPTWWGAVVTDGRFPAIWDANYARIDEPAPDVSLDDVAAALVPALDRSGTDVFHTVMFHPEETTGLLTELSTVGHTLSWDMIMERIGSPSITVDNAIVEELEPGAELWDRVGASMELFGIEPDVALQLRSVEEVLPSAGGKRWFGIRDAEDVLISLAALITLDGVGYVDDVATSPQGRGKGYASALTARVVDEALASGARHVCLLVDPDDPVVMRMYERLGFRDVGRLASTRGPLPGGTDRMHDG